MHREDRLPDNTASNVAPVPPSDDAGISPGEWRAGLATAFAVFIAVLALALTLRPPLSNYDGYIYRLQALGPLRGDAINPHHVLWYPILRGVAVVSAALGSPSPEAFQLFGILINGLGLALFCLLLIRRTGRLALPFALAIFIALSPRIWYLGFQNQPYPLLNLCLVAFLWAVGEGEALSRRRMIASGLALGAAVLLQQGMALVVPAVALGWALAGGGGWRSRGKTAVAWAGATTLGVAAVYLAMAAFAGVKPAGFSRWILLYLQDQHGIQVQWPQSAIKSVIGMARAVFDAHSLRNAFSSEQDLWVIWSLYTGLLVAGCVAAIVVLSRRRVREGLLGLLRSNPAFTSVTMLVLAWSAFVFLWEPTGYYWCVNLFPLAFLASWWMRARRKQAALVVTAGLLLLAAWNLYVDHRRDRVYSVNYPPPMLEQVRAELGPNDIFIVAGRDWYANIDYDLLLACLDNWPNDPAIGLLDEYVLARAQQPWQQKLDLTIREALAAGGRVYVADHVFWYTSYWDLEHTADPFSEYSRERYAGVNGGILQNNIKSFFGQYELRPSTFRIGTDRFGELKAVK